MPNYLIERFRILTSGKAVPWWWRLAYLIPDPYLKGDVLENVAKFAHGQDKHFNSVIENHVSAYLEKGTMPPAAIMAPVLNIAEDITAGRQVTLRAGDYIALQNFARSQK